LRVERGTVLNAVLADIDGPNRVRSAAAPEVDTPGLIAGSYAMELRWLGRIIQG